MWVTCKQVSLWDWWAEEFEHMGGGQVGQNFVGQVGHLNYMIMITVLGLGVLTQKSSSLLEICKLGCDWPVASAVANHSHGFKFLVSY